MLLTDWLIALIIVVQAAMILPIMLDVRGKWDRFRQRLDNDPLMLFGFWHEWRGTMDGIPLLYVRKLFCRRWVRIGLHKIVAPDMPGCFHTHPANAIRIILWGGYIEELRDGRLKTWRPGMIGWVPPPLSHRIHALRRGNHYSIWIRFSKRAEVRLQGPGWAEQDQTHRAPDTVLDYEA